VRVARTNSVSLDQIPNLLAKQALRLSWTRSKGLTGRLTAIGGMSGPIGPRQNASTFSARERTDMALAIIVGSAEAAS
jgi:hypothetical protein